MNAKKFICAPTFVFLLAALTGCGTEKGLGIIEVSNGWGSADVKTIILEDGTKCAVLIGSNKGAIHCSWHTVEIK